MASLRTALAVAVLMAFVCLAAAQKPPKPSEPPKNAPLKPAVPPKSPPLGPPTQALQQGEAVEEKAGFVAMYYGILVLFVILWTIYLFLYFFEYGSAGDSTFWLTSYGVCMHACEHACEHTDKTQACARTHTKSANTHVCKLCQGCLSPKFGLARAHAY